MKDETVSHQKFFTKVVILFAFILFQGTKAQDYFDWSIRTDHFGKPAGIFENTPFPVDENSNNYVIKNDEYPNRRSYELGVKYFVG